MSNSNSSREVTEKKKKDVWQEAGEEFYTESYPSGSGPPEEVNVQPRNRSGIPLPSLTARKNSYGYHNRRRSTFGRTATANTTNTNPYTTYNSTTRLGVNHEVHVSTLPDLADMTIPNERKRWKELLRIKSMPIAMAAKRELKTQLTTIPMLKLKGTKRLKWNLQMLKESILLKWRHRCRRHLLWESSLREIEDHSGTRIADVFVSLKWTVYFNVLLFLILNIFVIIPQMVFDEVEANFNCSMNYSADTSQWMQDSNSTRIQVSDCCALQYSNILRTENEEQQNRWVALLNALNISTDGWTNSLTYGFYKNSKLVLPFMTYDLPVGYILIPIFVFVLTILIGIVQIRGAIKEVALGKEGEFYKFSNLIFAGWDHYTRNSDGAKFRKRILKNEMKISLETEKMKVATESTKEKCILWLKRFFSNILVFCIFLSIACANFYITDYSLQKSFCVGSNCTITNNEIIRNNTTELEFLNTTAIILKSDSIAQFLPSVSIVLTNFFILLILKQISNFEGHFYETEKSLLFIRALIGRFLVLGSVGAKFIIKFYCTKQDSSCTVCQSADEEKERCWESALAMQIIIYIIVDGIFQLVFTFGFAYGRFIVQKLIPCKRIPRQSFWLTKHKLDVICIQSISLLFYFCPFLPIFVILYLFLIFYFKKFTLTVISGRVSETVRTTKGKAVDVGVKMVAFVVVSIALGFVILKLEPSKSCGPFRTNTRPWDVLTDLEHRSTQLTMEFITSPHILIPILILISIASYFYYSSAKANRRMVETLKHMLILEGHDKQYLFARLNTVPEVAESSTFGNLDTNPTVSAP